MKKNAFSMMAMAALMLAATSCQKEGVDEPQGEYANVTFTAQLPSGINQRVKANGPRKAYSDGKTATTLHYAVYEDGQTTPLAVCNGQTEGTATFASGSLTTTVTLKLPTDKAYDIIFFAQSADAPYTFSAANHNFTINYDNVKANDETLDAFYAKYDYDGTSTTNEVTLKRPFAQLNIGTDDLDDFNEGSSTKLTKTEVTVSGVGDALDLLSGTVSNVEEHKFASNSIPTETFVKDGYKYLAMDYLLVSAEQSLVDVTLNSDAKATVGKYTNVPVQRNYRTNIFGSLLTKGTDFNVTIDPDYDGDYGYTLVTTDAELAEAVKTENAKVLLAPATTFAIPSTIAKGVTFLGTDKTSVLNVKDVKDAKDPKNITISNLSDITFNNLTIDGVEKPSSWYPGFWSSTNFKFENCELKGEMTLYGNKCTFDNCTFTQTSYEYCIYTYGCEQPTFTNCTFNTAGKAVKVYNEGGNSTEATFNNCKFIATNSDAAAAAAGKTPDKAAIEIDGYQGNTPFTVNINNCTATGFKTATTTGSDLYGVENGGATTVVVDGTKVYPN